MTSNSRRIARDSLKYYLTHPWDLYWAYPRGDLGMVRDLWRGVDWTEANRRRMDGRADDDPETAVGGMTDEVGPLQFEYLLQSDLEPSDELLDVGCGSLRGGQWAIAYLDGGYIGMDISQSLMDAGEASLPDVIRDKDYRLIQTSDLRLREFGDEEFDCAIAQSLVTHLPPGEVEDLVASLSRVLKRGGVAHMTVFLADENEVRGPSSFAYSEDWLVKLGEEFDLGVEVIPEGEYPHPRGQRMVTFRRPGGGR